MTTPSNTPRRRSFNSFQELKNELSKTQTNANETHAKEESQKTGQEKVNPGQCPICKKHIGRGITGHIKSCQLSSSFKTG